MYQRMIDTESTGLGRNAIILTIGIVDFDLQERTIQRKLLIHLNREEQYRRGAVIELGTMEFWSDHPEVFARQMGTADDGDSILALRDCVGCTIKGESPQYWWMKNKNHDRPMIEWALEQAGLTHPWPYNRVRDIYEYESLVNAQYETNFEVCRGRHLGNMAESHGYHFSVKHDALNDALYQVATLFAVWDIFAFTDLK